MFAGYWRLPDRTAVDHRADGYFVTGDIGRLDRAGRLTLEGRRSDMIISGGFNIYPREIEAVIDAVEGVVESAVIGLPDADLGEVAVAVVVCAEATDAATIDAALRERLAGFKRPRAIVRVDALPRNAMGKVQKSTLREDHADALSR